MTTSLSSQQLTVSRERLEDLLHVLERVVCVRREAEVAGAGGRDDPVAAERLDERRRVGRGDAEQGTATLRLPRSRDRRAEGVEPVEERGVQAEHVLPRLGD